MNKRKQGRPGLRGFISKPIYMYVFYSQKYPQFYYSGVFDSYQCSSTNLNHAAVITGFGTLNNKKYWLLKNRYIHSHTLSHTRMHVCTHNDIIYIHTHSWGDTWGISGYIMMSRDKYNQCGIATAASYPTL